jgi:hypothetical protein
MLVHNPCHGMGMGYGIGWELKCHESIDLLATGRGHVKGGGSLHGPLNLRMRIECEWQLKTLNRMPMIRECLGQAGNMRLSSTLKKRREICRNQHAH